MPAGIPGVIRGGGHGKSLDEDVMAHQRVLCPVCSPGDLEAALQVLAECVHEEHAPIDHIVECVARPGDFRLFEGSIVPVPRSVQLFDRTVFFLQPLSKQRPAPLAVAEHISDSFRVIGVPPQLIKVIVELRG